MFRLYFNYWKSVFNLVSFYIIYGIPLWITKSSLLYIDLSILHGICLYHNIIINSNGDKNDDTILSLISKMSHMWFGRYRKYCIILYIDIIRLFIKGFLCYICGIFDYKRINEKYIPNIENIRNKIGFKYRVSTRLFDSILDVSDELQKLL